MKTIKLYNYAFFIIFSVVLLLSSCVDFLEKTPEAEVTEKDVFGTYESMQGFVDYAYAKLMDYNRTYFAYNLYYGGESVKNLYRHRMRLIFEGNYWILMGPDNISHMWQVGRYRGYGEGIEDKDFGIWAGGWRGIRIANTALANMDLLIDATQEEKDLIKGQALFFRAYFHGDIMKTFGGMPYIDTVLSATDELRYPRLTYQECTERIIEDLDKAIPLLPKDWDETGPGSQRIGANEGRITRGAALAYKQKYLLYAGSPLMNGFSGKDFTYNEDYCKRAAEAGWEMIKLAREGYHRLLPMEEYHENFHNSNQNTVVWSDETILQRVDRRVGRNHGYHYNRRLFFPTTLGGSWHWPNCPNYKIIDRYEMADGTRYKEEYDYDDNKRWKNRDPRFHFTYMVDREKIGDNPQSQVKFYIDNDDAQAAPANGSMTGIMIKKFTSYNATLRDRQYTRYQIACPLMRFAQVYLDYAEAVTVAYGADGKAPGADLTAVDAINIIRERAGMPPVTSLADGYDSFMELVRNERTVELMWEAHYWFDNRRWYIAHLPEYKEIIALDYDKDYTYFNRRSLGNKVHENPKHYWFPIYRDQVMLYEEFYQNPGW